MGTEPTMTLLSVRKDGRSERTKLAPQTLADARELAKWVLHVGNGLYTEVDICAENGTTVERIQNPAVASPVRTAYESQEPHGRIANR